MIDLERFRPNEYLDITRDGSHLPMHEMVFGNSRSNRVVIQVRPLFDD